MMASIRILLVFAIYLVMVTFYNTLLLILNCTDPQNIQVGCLPHYYNNRHRYSDYYSKYHYSYANEPSYSQPAGRWESLFSSQLSPLSFPLKVGEVGGMYWSSHLLHLPCWIA